MVNDPSTSRVRGASNGQPEILQQIAQRLHSDPRCTIPVGEDGTLHPHRVTEYLHGRRH
ncbi:MAG: hypothetical protein LC721_04615 [Actinobacteria bacterium]|nr:hypothetical protein [Actinomycetota bacterium]